MCVLYQSDVEYMNNLMIHFLFLNQFGGRSKKFLNLCIVGIFRKWINSLNFGIGVKKWKELLCFVCWELWNHMNYVLFEGKTKSVWIVVSKVTSRHGEFHKEKVSKKMICPRIPTLNIYMPVGFLDRAS